MNALEYPLNAQPQCHGRTNACAVAQHERKFHVVPVVLIVGSGEEGFKRAMGMAVHNQVLIF
ncbi:hypothetical protein NLQ78_24015, partial [Escherichia coli]|nr:hypothetical protein [Escherichia coli]